MRRKPQQDPLALSLADGLRELGGGAVRLTGAQRAELVARSGLRHARYHAVASSLGVIAARSVMAALPGAADRAEPMYQGMGLGVVAAGGVSHVSVAWQATETVVKHGPDALNPLMFPHTIPSAMPCAVAAAVGARAFAIAVGHDEAAFFDVLRLAVSFTRAGLARHVLALGVVDADPFVDDAAVRAGVDRRFGSAAIAALVGPQPRRAMASLLATPEPEENLDRLCAAAREWGIPDDSHMCISFRSAASRAMAANILELDVWTACGAVFLMTALRTASMAGQDAPLFVAIETDSRACGVVVQAALGNDA